MARHHFPIGRMLATACVLAALLSSGRAHAQDVNPPPGGPGTQGPMTVELVHDGWAIAPDVKVTRFDGGTHALAGAYGGRVFDKSLLIGGAGYWLTDPNRARGLSYGGALVEWREGTERTVGFSIKGLFGLGTATVSRTVTLIGFDRDRNVPTSTNLGTASLAFREDFVVAEPQADLLVHAAPHVRLHLGIGYRAVGGARGLAPEIRGATGSISLEIGPASRP